MAEHPDTNVWKYSVSDMSSQLNSGKRKAFWRGGILQSFFAFARASISDNQHDISIIHDRVLGLAWFGRPKGVCQAISGPSSFKVKTSLAKACWT